MTGATLRWTVIHKVIIRAGIREVSWFDYRDIAWAEVEQVLFPAGGAEYECNSAAATQACSFTADCQLVEAYGRRGLTPVGDGARVTATAVGDLLVALGVVGWVVNILLLDRATVAHRIPFWRRPVHPLPLRWRLPAALGTGMFVFGASYGYHPGKWLFDVCAFVIGLTVFEVVRRMHSRLM